MSPTPSPEDEPVHESDYEPGPERHRDPDRERVQGAESSVQVGHRPRRG